MVIVSLRKTRAQSWDCLTAREKKLKDSKEYVLVYQRERERERGGGGS
jgi:hypothetical protein